MGVVLLGQAKNPSDLSPFAEFIVGDVEGPRET